MSSLRTVVIVPARDEQERVGATVTALLQVPGIDHVLVVDDGSRDETAERAREAGAEVVSLGRSIGKGGAMDRGVRETPADVVVFADADLGSSASGMAPVLAAVVEGRADLAIATLPPQGGGFGMIKRLARWSIQRACGRRMTEPLSGQRAITAAGLAGVRPLAPRFGVEVAMTIDAVRSGATVVEIETDLRHAPPGKTAVGVMHRVRQGADIMRAALPRMFSGKRKAG